MENLQVMKIGGAVLNNPQNFINLYEIIKDYCNRPTVFVFSAFSDLSRKLRQSGRIAKNEGLENALAFFSAIKKELNQMVDSLFQNMNSLNAVRSKLVELFDSFEKILFGIAITKELTKRTLDRLLSYGEYFSLVVLEEYLKSKNVKAAFLDSAELIITDSNYGNAKPIIDKTAKTINDYLVPQLKNTNLVFLPGFIGSTEFGTITTMGFESSNLTALLIASILEADSVTFWTNVEGIRTSDPKIVANTQLVPEISFDDALLASLNGVKLIHPSMYGFFKQYPNIKYIYKSAFSPESGETFIVRETNFKPKLVLISEPNFLVEQPNESQVEINPECSLFYKAKDYSFCLTEEFDNNRETTETLSIITLLYIEPENVFKALEKISNRVRFVITDSSKPSTKVLVEREELPTVANFLHDFLIIKK